MRTLLDLVPQQVAKTMPLDHFWQVTLGGFGRVCRRIATSAQAIGLVVCLALASLFLIPATPAYAQMLNPQEVVEYALTLEKLEADFYRRAVDAAEDGGLQSLPDEAKAAIRSYGQDEAKHTADLSAVLRTLGGNPNAVQIPNNPNYNAILGRNPFANPRDFLLALQYVEDLGVSAYKGQVQNLLRAKGAASEAVLAGALEIHTVEARHAAGIRYLRQIFYGANIRPWIRNKNEVIYNENRNDPVIDFDNVAFDGFSTADEVLELVGPVLRR